MRIWKLLNIPSMCYDEARSLQLALVERRRRDPGVLDLVMLLEHPAVVTVGRRGDLSGLRVGEEFLSRRGVPLRVVERGGLITYHGPGQLVGYPVLDLRANGLKVVEFVGALEEVMIRVARGFGIHARRSPLNRGVWVGGEKLGSVGIAVRGGISFHGFAINVNTDLEPFGWMDPCGLKGVLVTSMAAVLGAEVPMPQVRAATAKHIEEIFGVQLSPMDVEDLVRMVSEERVLLGCARGLS